MHTVFENRNDVLSVLASRQISCVTMKRVQELPSKLIQRINIHFCVKIGLPIEATLNALHLVFPDCLSDARIRFWYRQFRQGRTTLVDLQRAPRGKTSRSPVSIQAVKTLVEADPRITIARIKNVTDIPMGSIHKILHKDLKLTLQCARFVPHLLTPCHLRLRYDLCRAMLNSTRGRGSNLLQRIITSDEAWVYQYDPATRRQSSQWAPPGTPRETKPRRARATGKVLLITFFDHKGMVHYEMLRNETVTSAVFIRVLGNLHQALRNHRPRQRQPWVLHMDNASAHTSCRTKLHLLFSGMRTLPHPPYSPDLAPNDFWFFPRLKRGLKGRVFANLDDLEAAVHHEVSLIAAYEYSEAILQKWPMRWGRCLNRDGDYFEGVKE